MENNGVQDVEDGEENDGNGIGDDEIEVRNVPEWEVLRLP